MNHKDAAAVISRYGAICVTQDSAPIDLVVIGEEGIPMGSWEDTSSALLSEQSLAGVAAGDVQLLSEAEFWQRLGLTQTETESGESRLFTARMLAELLDVAVDIIRRWQRRGLIRPVKEIRRLAYFDFREVAAARQLASLVSQGVSPTKIERQLRALSQHVPGVDRPLAQLAVLVEGRSLLLRSGEGLVDAAGQRRFDFAHEDAEQAPSIALPTTSESEPETPQSLADQYLASAEQLEDEGDLRGAAESYRAALAAGGPQAEVNFALAELLYRLGDVNAARERYYVTLELDEDYVEARANLGCVLLEAGQTELAIAAFQGALASHPEYPDAHYHLARTLDELNESDAAAQHWQEFLRQAPASPWADEARQRLGEERLAT